MKLDLEKAAKKAAERLNPDMDLHLRAEARFVENQSLDLK